MGLLVWYFQPEKRAKRRLIRESDSWFEEYLAVRQDDKALAELRPPPEGAEQLPSIQRSLGRVAEARKLLDGQESERMQVKSMIDAWRSQEDLSDELEAMYAGVRSWEFRSYIRAHLRDDLVWLQKQVSKTARANAFHLLQRARAGDARAFHDLRVLVRDFFKYTEKPYQRPEDWDELVVKYVDNPVRSDFSGRRTEFTDGQVRLLAAEALRTRSLLKAQVVLAACKPDGHHDNHWNHRRSEVGDCLLKDVVVMVDELLAARVTIDRTSFIDTTT